MKWPWRRRCADTTDEGREALAHVDRRDADITRLGEHLRDVEARNHFSAMVRQAIARTPRED